MPDSQTVAVTILDKEYQIACPPEERGALRAAAKELDERMRVIRNTGNVIGLDRIAVMAALNLCHEVQELQGGGTADTSGLDKETLTRLRKKIDKALESW